MESSREPVFRLIAGLGNPGREYAETRHNAGFLLCDRLAERDRVEFRLARKWHAAVAQSGGVYYCKPMTFMNLSGAAVRSAASFYKVPPGQVLVVYDDMALPLGKLRLRPRGSAGGHNGLQSIIEHFGTQDIPRLRIGIGTAEGKNMVGHVLGRFSKEERQEIDGALTRAIEAIDFAQREGISAAMNSFN